MKPPSESERLAVEYPCAWGYRLIGTCEASMRALVAQVVGAHEHAVRSGRQSATGRYVSLEVTVTVTDEAHRLEVYHRLREAEFVRVVL